MYGVGQNFRPVSKCKMNNIKKMLNFNQLWIGHVDLQYNYKLKIL